MNPLKTNIVANFTGSIWQGTIALVFIPFYIRFMGIESYGLVGIFATLQVMFGLLDIGLGSTLTREMARLSVLQRKEQEMRNLVRTLETFYWGIAIFVGITFVLLSPIIARHWIIPGQLSPKTIEQALLIMGFLIAFQMPIGFYSGGLMGLQKQVQLNVVNVSMSTLRGVGAVLILWLVSPTIQAFLLWQIAVSVLNFISLALFLWSSLPHCKNKTVFQRQLLKGVWRFTAGMSAITILATILTQLDKVILSKMLSLEMFGYYTLANVVAMSLGRLFTPVFYSIYPRLTQLVSIDDQEGLIQLYHKSCQFMSVLIMPIAIVITFFSYEIMLLWTQNSATAAKTYLLVSILICGTALNGLMNLPYALQLAFGWTRLSVLKNIIALILIVPLLIVLALHYGAIGVAYVWLILNIGYIFIEIPIMHRKILNEEKWRWYWHDVCLPFIACMSSAFLGRILFRGIESQFMILMYLMIVSILTFTITFFSLPVMRSILHDQLIKIGLVPKHL